ncbi:MAG: bifunctional folylpolyglutamate synthase/dihydrofolate synthase [Clostridia bacterium]|nr:bifunctional folylpolyglutamate synthase/dihydrofolate synthase [Clostridia bacterium]
MNAVDYIHSLRTFGKKAGLKNIEALLGLVGNPHEGMSFIHVAGTNGKGSVSSMINSILIAQNKKVGLFTSPFIEYFNERICINNIPISNSDLERITMRVKCAVKLLEKDDIYCTVFDVICAVGFIYFKECNCDVVVLEVGLGGRFDATNIIKNPLCTVICAIGYDHMQYLGNTLEEIAFEKCGTIKENCPVVSYPLQDKSVAGVISDICTKKNSHLILPDTKELDIKKCDINGSVFNYRGDEYNLKLVGEYQVYNALCAVEVASYLGIEYSIIKKGIETAMWKCRFEVFKTNDKTIVIDGAHNSHGISAFLSSADKFFVGKKVHYIFGILNEKDIDKACSVMAGANGKITVTSVPSERCINPEEVYNLVSINHPETDYIQDNHQAFKTVVESDCDVICILGSLYMAGEMRKNVEKFSQTDKTI